MPTRIRKATSEPRPGSLPPGRLHRPRGRDQRLHRVSRGVGTGVPADQRTARERHVQRSTEVGEEMRNVRIDATAAYRLVEMVVAEKGADHRYPMGGQCEYFSYGGAACLIGHVID